MNPTIYNGQTFTSQSEAARQLGVHHNTIWRHLSVHGNLDRLHDERVGIFTKAKELSVSRSTIYRHLKKFGSLDRVKGETRGKPIQVRVGRMSWRSYTQMSLDIGVDRKTLTHWLKPTASKHQKERLHQMIAALEESK